MVSPFACLRDVVLAGSYEESGQVGRICATTGDVLIHPVLDAHANRIISGGLKLIRLDWSDISEMGGLYHLDEVDALVRIAEKDVREAQLLLALAGRVTQHTTQPKPWSAIEVPARRCGES